MKSVLVFALLFFSISAYSQVPPPELTDQDLRDWLKQNYYDGKHIDLDYFGARRKMYAYIDNDNGNITCIYSGFSQTNPVGNEITYPNPINTEHTVPQSFFGYADPMKGDIHHLFPTYGKWNSIRSNYKFADLPDTETAIWMRDSICPAEVPPLIPTTLIDEYSECNTSSFNNDPGNRFEPREDHKGDIARAVFYFYTMYPNAGTVITDVAALETLCAWHEQDPPSLKERNRNDAIEVYQGDRNPYIDQPELISRAWGCDPILPLSLLEFKGYLKDNVILLEWKTAEEEGQRFQVEHSLDGREWSVVQTVESQGVGAFDYQMQHEQPALGDNLYRLRIVDADGTFVYSAMISIKYSARDILSVNPNPFSNTVSISLNTMGKNLEVSLSDLSGKTIYQENLRAEGGRIAPGIHWETLPRGIYFLAIAERGKVYVKKLVKL